MIKHKGLEALRKSTPKEVKEFIDHSFATVARIDFLLQKQGKNRSDLARDLGKSESEISKWMSGAHNFTGKTIAKIQVVLGEKVWVIPDDLPKQFLFQSRIGASAVIFSFEGRFIEGVKRTEGNFDSVKEQFESSELCHLYN